MAPLRHWLVLGSLATGITLGAWIDQAGGETVHEIAGALHKILHEIDKRHGLMRNEIWVLLNTGTPQMQSVWLLLASMGLLAIRFIQTCPPDLAAQSGTPPVRELSPDFSRWREIFAPTSQTEPR